jgi:hypothetical protein
VRTERAKATLMVGLSDGAPLAARLDLDVRSRLPGSDNVCVPVKGALGGLSWYLRCQRGRKPNEGGMYSRKQSRMVCVAGVERTNGRCVGVFLVAAVTGSSG